MKTVAIRTLFSGFGTPDQKMDTTTMGELVDFFQELDNQPEVEAISVLLVDDQPVFRNVARSVLERDGECEVIGEATDGAHAIALMSKLNPDIVVMDVQMGDMSGVEATRRILSRHPQANIVLTSMGSDSEYPILAREIGARGFVPKRNLNVEMLAALLAADRQAETTLSQRNVRLADIFHRSPELIRGFLFFR